MKICPKCKSANIEVFDILGFKGLHCKDCGYDEEALEAEISKRSTQREKTKHSPYKKGGSRRTN